MEKQNVKEMLEKELRESLCETQVRLRTIKILSSFQDWLATQSMTGEEFDMVYSALRQALKDVPTELCVTPKLRTSEIHDSFQEWLATQCITREECDMVYSALRQGLKDLPTTPCERPCWWTQSQCVHWQIEEG